MMGLIARIFNRITRGKNTDSTFLHHHESAYTLLLAKLSSLRVGIFLYAYDKLILGKHLKNLEYSKGTKSQIDALIIANGPSCNKLNLKVIKELQSKGQLEILGLNNSKLLAEDSVVKLDYLLLSDPMDAPKDESKERLLGIEESNPQTKLLTPLGWHKYSFLKDCKLSNCLHFIDSGRNQFTLQTSPVKLRSYPPMGIFKLLAIAKYFDYKTVYIIGLDLTFYKTVRLGANGEILQDPFYFKAGYGETSNDSHLFPSGMTDYFHFVSQNFLALRTYFNLPTFINLDVESMVDAFPKIERESSLNLLLNSQVKD